MRNRRLPVTAFFLRALLCCLALSLLASCAASTSVTAHWVPGAKLEPATYTLILYRNLAVDYLTAAAFLDREDDDYTILPRDPDFTYTVIKGLQPGEALQAAENFFRLQPSYSNAEVRSITGPEGNLLGYELRPLYQPFVYGTDDVLDISYSLKGGHEVEVWIRLKRQIYDQLFLDSTRR